VKCLLIAIIALSITACDGGRSLVFKSYESFHCQKYEEVRNPDCAVTSLFDAIVPKAHAGASAVAASVAAIAAANASRAAAARRRRESCEKNPRIQVCVEHVVVGGYPEER
jgi:hypothetical protein